MFSVFVGLGIYLLNILGPQCFFVCLFLFYKSANLLNPLFFLYPIGFSLPQRSGHFEIPAFSFVHTVVLFRSICVREV